MMLELFYGVLKELDTGKVFIGDKEGLENIDDLGRYDGIVVPLDENELVGCVSADLQRHRFEGGDSYRCEDYEIEGIKYKVFKRVK